MVLYSGVAFNKREFLYNCANQTDLNCHFERSEKSFY